MIIVERLISRGVCGLKMYVDCSFYFSVISQKFGAFSLGCYGFALKLVMVI